MSAVLTAGGIPATLADFAKGAKPKENAIQKIRYSHDSMIDQIIANPWVSQGELAAIYGYTQGWVSQVIASDAFQARLAERKEQIIDPTLRMTVEENFRALAKQSLRVLLNKLNQPDSKISDETALRAAEISAKALGMGPAKANVQVNNSFVVAVPQKSASSAEWLANHGSAGQSVANSSGGRTYDALTSSTPALVVPASGGPTLDTKALLKELSDG